MKPEELNLDAILGDEKNAGPDHEELTDLKKVIDAAQAFAKKHSVTSTLALLCTIQMAVSAIITARIGRTK